MLRVEHLFISPGHNFFGHHGQPAGEHPIVAVGQIDCVAGRGIRGDRFFDYKENYKGQITFFSMEVLEALRNGLNLPAAQPEATRRNAFVRGLDLGTLIGRPFEVQGVRFEGVEESKPCHWMNSALGPGAEEWLRGRAGLRCRILTDGILRCERSVVKHDQTPRRPLEVSAIILAGGASTRMGRDKAWVEFVGKPLIQVAVERVRALGVSEILIAGRTDGDYPGLDSRVVFDLESGFGPLAGIERGLHECACPLLLVLAVDLPRMSASYLRKLLGRCDRLIGAVPKLNGRFEPLVAVYPKRCHAFAFAAIARGQPAVQDFVRACLAERAVRVVPVSQADAECFANCNTPAELVRSHPDSPRAEHLFPR